MTPDQIREVFRHALREGDLHEDCSLCQERIDAAIAACLKHAPTAPMWVPVLKGQPAPDADLGPDCGFIVAHSPATEYSWVPPTLPHPGADRVLRAVYVWCAMAASAAKAWEDAGHYHGC